MGKKVKSKYRVKKNLIKETKTNKEINCYYTIEKRRKKYFIFGPEIWVSYIDFFGYQYPYQYKNVEVALSECKRLNENLPIIYNDYSIVTSIVKDKPRKFSNIVS